MKITILANRDLASCIALNRLFPLLKDHELCIFLSAKVGKYDRLPQALLDLKFYEQQLFNNIVFPLTTALGIENATLKTFDAIGKEIGKPILELNAINIGFRAVQKHATGPGAFYSLRRHTARSSDRGTQIRCAEFTLRAAAGIQGRDGHLPSHAQWR